MLNIAFVSLSGGQGKTTTALLMGRILAQQGFNTLMVDGDPQANLTTYLGHQVEEDAPTLMEVLKKICSIEEGIYPVEGTDKLFLIPADDGLNSVQDYLANSGVGAILLKKRLSAIANVFDVCVVDSPPQRSQLALTIIGASDALVIPAEAAIKGYGSLTRTLDLIKELQDADACDAELLGIVPFRDKWVGRTQTKESQQAIAAMQDEVGKEQILPSLRESERYKQAINQSKTLREMGFPDLEYPFEELLKKIVSKKGG